MKRIVGGSPDTKPWQYLAAVLGVLSVLFAAGTGMMRTLGLLVHRQRENLVDSPPLEYREYELLLAGLETLSELPWRSLSALISSHGVLRGGAWALLVLSITIVWGSRRMLRRWKIGEVVLLGVASLLTVVLFIGTAFTTIAVRAENLAEARWQDEAQCTNRLTRNWADMVAYETCTWLHNDTAVNDERRQSLGGMPLWLLVTVIATGVAIRRKETRKHGVERRAWRLWYLALIVALALVGLLVLRLWPSAHAYATWGLEYPAARLGSGAGCEEHAEEAEAVAADICCAYDITEAAEQPTLLMTGPTCPDSLRGALQADRQCIRIVSGGRRVISQGCR